MCLIDKTMLDVLYCSCERLDQPEFFRMELKTYILQNIATSKMMFSRSKINDHVWLRNENLHFCMSLVMSCF